MHIFAELCNTITRQAMELESCSNLRIREVFWLRFLKICFVLGLGFSVGDVIMWGMFLLFWPILPGLGRQPKSHFLGSSFFGI